LPGFWDQKLSAQCGKFSAQKLHFLMHGHLSNVTLAVSVIAMNGAVPASGDKEAATWHVFIVDPAAFTRQDHSHRSHIAGLPGSLRSNPARVKVSARPSAVLSPTGQMV
jgi:hypothetical protein